MDYNKIIDLVKKASMFVFDETLRDSVSLKGAADFVTNVDISISNFLKRELKAVDPAIGFFSEEEKGSLQEKCWILDPIDGTTNLVYGYNMSSVSLALYDKGQIVFGVVYNPFNGECYTAEIGKGAFLNGKPLRVSDREMKNSIIEFGAGSTRKQDAEESFALGKEIFKRCTDIRRICSSALAICFIAAGRIDGYFESRIKPWDYAAGSLILKEAGGMITDYGANQPPMDKPSSVIASNGRIHAELHSIIGQYRTKE